MLVPCIRHAGPILGFGNLSLGGQSSPYSANLPMYYENRILVRFVLLCMPDSNG